MLTKTKLVVISATIALMTVPAMAQNANAKGGNRGQGKAISQQAVGGCPPGLAKKTPACVPPGLAKKQGDEFNPEDYDRDDRLTRRERRRLDLPGLEQSEDYYRVQDQVLKVDRKRRVVLDAYKVLKE